MKDQSGTFNKNTADNVKSRRILLVDDEEDIAIVIKKLLSASGFEVDAFTRPQDVLDNFKAGLYDLLLLDIRMPGMSGFELYRELKKIDPSVRACFLTAFEIYESEFKKVFSASDVQTFIKKPVGRTELIKHVKLELEKPATKLSSGDHILAIYATKEEMINDGLRHLQSGLSENNESVLLIIDDEQAKNEARKRMVSEWRVDIVELESKGRITIKTFNEWYLPEGKFDPQATSQNWFKAVQIALENGSKGLRAFGDMSPFFVMGKGVELVDYEATLGKRIDAPITGICAYTSDSIKGLPPLKAELLRQCHHMVLEKKDK